MGGRKRKATYYAEEDDWLPTYAAGPGSSNYATAAGSSSNPIVLDDTPPKPKRQRKAKDSSAPAAEKRAARMKARPPQNILERLERVRLQRHVEHRVFCPYFRLTNCCLSIDSSWWRENAKAKRYGRNFKS